MNNRLSTKELVLMGLMIALVWLAGSVIKIPSVGGFVHLGDCMVFLSVVVLGKKKGSVASAMGMMLVDVLGGYYLWAPFTFVIKGAMAYIAGSILEKLEVKHGKSFSYVISFLISGVFMVIAYFGAGIIMATFLTEKAGLIQGIVYSAKDIVGNIIQVGTGIVIALPVSAVVLKAKSEAFLA
ncbi:ECF transporter S component [Clostridium butyricum]|uniref:Membrane spanning protein n=1 Tax=Clostridium butyricum E4 str. BoNT E BL5262 TaxID=632245 RepID=C4IM69_CLOBU|nr:ECF transporter S component [Clostridium butyricum]APF21874.1 ECF-type riboflavin transporter, S component family protein [Clostridium butyricum]EDT74616.1 membrane spanning protein [Clostridium butyricum 5521]EEP52716.1 membrane spanning protein [Clostridium butyricum E4 str. BoNT E BL5262]NFL32234.1 ECF transporter S component [Clostridium butyricum]NFS19089.1 ECF transporter S component [Clostridium butyricum]